MSERRRGRSRSRSPIAAKNKTSSTDNKRYETSSDGRSRSYTRSHKAKATDPGLEALRKLVADCTAEEYEAAHAQDKREEDGRLAKLVNEARHQKAQAEREAQLAAERARRERDGKLREVACHVTLGANKSVLFFHSSKTKVPDHAHLVEEFVDDEKRNYRKYLLKGTS